MKICQLGLRVLWIIAFVAILITSEPKRIVCYIGTDSATRPGRGSFHLRDLDATLCTHVILGFPRLKSEYTIDLLASWIEFMKGTNITTAKRKFPGVIFMMALGGWYNGVQVFYKSAENEESRRTLAQTSLDFVKEHDFGGLELCWLYPTKRGGFISDRIIFVELLKEFKNKFAENNLIFTALLGGSYTTIDAGYDVKKIFQIVDFVDLISYDYNGLWSDNIAPNAPLYSDNKSNVNYTVQHLIELGADRGKITIGIPFYGRILFAPPGHQKPNLGDLFDRNKDRIRTFMGPYTRDESGDIAFNEICLEQLQPGKWEEHWDNKSQTPYLVTNDKLITYENMTSMEMKVRYAFKENLGGVMVFSVDQDDFRGDCLNKSKKTGKYKNYPMLRKLNELFKMYAKELEINNSQSQIISLNCVANSKLTKILFILLIFSIF